MNTRPPVGAKVIVKYREDGRTPADPNAKMPQMLNAAGVVCSHNTSRACVRIRFVDGLVTRTSAVFYSRLELVDTLLTPVPLCRAVDML